MLQSQNKPRIEDEIPQPDQEEEGRKAPNLDEEAKATVELYGGGGG